MHYRKIIEAHRLFYEGEYRAFNYDGYMKMKDWETWLNPDLPSDEVRKLFNFIKSWDRFFRGDVKTFQRIYRDVQPTMQKLRNERIEDADFTEELKTKTRDSTKLPSTRFVTSKPQWNTTKPKTFFMSSSC